KIKYLCQLIWLKCRNNKFTVERREERIISIPVWVLLLAIIFAFWTVGVIMIVGLFFDCRYAIVGPDDLSAINNVMDKAGDVVDKVKEEVNNL
nr:UBA/TS-N domain protein [Lachnospiraceae bacterium]